MAKYWKPDSSGRRVLLRLYRKYNTATDALVYQQEVLQELTREFESLTGDQVDPLTVQKYMVNERKCSRWIRLRGVA